MIALLCISALNIILIAGVIALLRYILPEVPEEPVGLPKGTVRALLTLIVVSPIPVVIIGKFLGLNGNIPEQFWAIVGTIVGFYFGTRKT